jgi:hypothetical protein
VSFGFCWNRHETATFKNLWWVFPLQWCHRYSCHVLTLHILWARVFSSHCWRWFFVGFSKIHLKIGGFRTWGLRFSAFPSFHGNNDLRW